MSRDVQQLVTEAELQQVAALVLTGANDETIARELGVPSQRIQWIKKKEGFYDALKELTGRRLDIILNRWKKNLEGAEKHAWDAFIYNLKDKKSMEAVKMFVEQIGFKAEHAGEGGSGTINLIMPGTPSAEKVVDNANTTEEDI